MSKWGIRLLVYNIHWSSQHCHFNDNWAIHHYITFNIKKYDRYLLFLIFIRKHWREVASTNNRIDPAIHIFCLPCNKAQAGSCAQYRRETRNKIFHNLLKPHKAIWDAWIFLVMWFWHLFQNIAQASSVSVFFFSCARRLRSTNLLSRISPTDLLGWDRAA